MTKMISTLLAAAALWFASGCPLFRSDPVAKFINGKFPPVSLEEQRRASVRSAAEALSALTTPNVAFGARTADLETALNTAPMRKLGIHAIRVRGDDEMLRIEAAFSHRFVDPGPEASAETRALLAKLSPEIIGKTVIYAGITSAAAAEGPHTSELRLKLLPALHSVKVEKVVLREKTDVTFIGNLLATLLTRYADNVTGELSRSSLTDVIVPTALSGGFDASRVIRVTNGDVNASVTIEARPVSAPVRLLGIAWLITDRGVSAIAELVPVTSPNPPRATSLPPTYSDVKRKFEQLVADSFELPREAEGPWFAIRKDLVASIVNASLSQAAVCVSARGEAREQLSQRIAFPDESTVDCTPTRDCSSTRPCDFEPCRDTRGCNVCILRNPITGGCIQRGNDPICEAAKAAENERCRLEAAGRKFDCERLKIQDKAICEFEKSGDKVLCEAGKEALKRLARTGKFGDIDAGFHARTDAFRVCMRSFALSPDLGSVRAELDVQGEAAADVSLKFTPLDIVGHLTCQAPFTEQRTFRAALRRSEVTIASDIRLAGSSAGATVQFEVEPTRFPVRLQPSPVEFLLTSPNMALACQGLNLVRPLAVSLTPFVPELRGEVDYELKKQHVTVDLAIPSQKVGELAVDGTVQHSPRALFLFSTLRLADVTDVASAESHKESWGR